MINLAETKGMSRPLIVLENGYVVRGHISQEEIEIVIRQQDDPYFDFNDCCAQFEQGYYRWIPHIWEEHPEFDVYLHRSQPGRGAFPATCLWYI